MIGGIGRRSWRFIPAPAGNTHRSQGHLIEKCPVRSPRLRGTQDDEAAGIREARFIPAPAGNTDTSAALCQGPHGSSPRLRGTPRQPLRAKSLITVHPRACGEHAPVPIPVRHGGGSSPRLRGTRTAQAPRRRLGRFIPAPAGNTLPSIYC